MVESGSVWRFTGRKFREERKRPMSHPRKAILPLLLLALALISLQAFAQSSGPGSDLKDGIDQFRNGQYDKAILLFHNIILDPNAGTQKAAAYLLIAKSYIATGKLDDAEHNLEFYLATYPGAADYEEASYQKGRLLFMQEEYESAIQVLQTFISAYPKSSFVSSAWFWAGESMYGLGRLDDSLGVYQKIVTEYPTSAKVEAAQYKVSLIQLRKKEVELSKLLKWSHEDFLRSVEEYQNREKAYVQAIEAYQKRLAGSGSEEDRKIIADLQQQLAKKTDEAARLAAQLRAGGTAPAVTPAASDEAVKLQRLLAAKQAALALKETYLLWMASNGGAGK
jgi:tetratricopeptide (TPR) repeat protein